MTYTYQWFRGTTAIPDAILSTYTPVLADVGKVLKVRVTGSKTGYDSANSSSAASAAVLATTPSAPQSVTTSKNDAAGQATISWLPPASDGGSPITGYLVARDGTDTQGQGAWSHVYGPEKRTVTHINLAPGATYNLSITPINAIGNGVTTTRAVTMAKGTLISAVPTITGTPRVGSVLTANPGTWSPQPITFAYQWYRNGSPIAGAQAQLYTLVSVDVGQSVSVAVIGSKTGYTTVLRSSASIAIERLLTKVGTPTITGTPRPGYELTANPGVWAPAPVTLAYQWYRNGALIAGATEQTYDVITADAGKTLTVAVTGTKTGYTPATSTSAGFAIEGSLTTATPTITGTPAVGSTLTANSGTWGPAPVTYAYQWNRNGSPVAGATSQTYTLVTADAGQSITVMVTGSKAGYQSASRTSAVRTIEKQLTSVRTPGITGDVNINDVVTAIPGVWAPQPVTLSYQWNRNGTPIPGETEQTHTVTSDDEGTELTVTVTGRKTGYTTVARTSGALPIPGVPSVLHVSGAIAQDTTWDASTANVIVVDSTLIVNTGRTLTIRAGVVVKFAANAQLTVKGTLNAAGGDAEPVVLTSLYDDSWGGDTNLDANSTDPSTGDWDGIYIQGSGSISHAQITFGSGVRTEYSLRKLSLTDNVIHGFVWVYRQAEAPIEIIRNAVSVDGSSPYGIYVWDGYETTSSPVIEDNDVFGATSYAYLLFSRRIDVSLLGSNSAVRNGMNAFGIEGTTVGNWVIEDTLIPFVVKTYSTSDGLTVGYGAKITAPAGSWLKFDGRNAGLTVNGSLVANGTTSSPVIFTSIYDDSVGYDTNGDRRATAPSAGDWRGISGSGPRSVSNFQVRYI